MLLFISIFIVCHYVCSAIAEYSLINCTWPCPNQADKCVVTSEGANCQPHIKNSWILISPKKAPLYTGASVTIENQECISVPLPTLPAANQNDIPPAGHSIISWPIITAQRPQDDYLGNCGHSLYCHKLHHDASSPVCIDRLEYGDSCESTNQCSNGLCLDHVCYPLNETVVGDSNTYNNNAPKKQEGSHHRQTVEIVASISGIVGAIGVVLMCYAFYRRRNNARNKSDQASSTMDCVVENTHQQFAHDFLHDSSDPGSSPLSQQQYLTINMQQHMNNPNPPPYKP